MKYNLTPFRHALLAALLATAGQSARAQNVGVGTTAPDASAALDIVATNKGALLPRVASTGSVPSPATGLIVFQTGAPAGYYYNAGTSGAPSWQQIATASGAAVTASNGLTKTGQNVALGGTLTGATIIATGGNVLAISGTGKVGIGTSSPAGQFEVFSPSTAFNGPDQTQLDQSSNFGVTDNYYQTFTAGLTGTLQRIDTYGAGLSGGSVNVTAELFAGTTPTGTPLGTLAVTLPAYVNNSPFVATALTFAPAPAMTAGQVYCLRLTRTGGATYLLPALCPNNCYAGGAMSTSSGWDATFQTFISVPGTPAQTALLVQGGSVGVGTTTPTQKLEVAGTVYSTSGGFKFPDGTTQTTAAAAANLTGDVTSIGAATTYANVVPATKGGAGTVSGILKANGAGTVSAATAGTDYLTPTGSAAGLTNFPTLNQNTTGNAATATNTTGNAATVTTNANLTGDITSVGNATTYATNVPNAKGGAGTITGLLKATSGTVAAAVAGTDYAAATGSAAYIQNQSAADQAADFRISGSGYVGGSMGIGTTAPIQKLEVALGGVRAGSFTPFTAVSATNQGAHLQWNRTGNNGETWLINHMGNGTADAGIRFAGITTSTGTTPTEWARFLNNGNFGIGTTAPGQKLEVAGQVFSNTGGFRFPDNTVQTTAATSAALITASNGLTRTSNDIRLGGTLTQATSVANAGFALNVTGTGSTSFGGSVGIGTTAPIQKLEVETGGIRAAGNGAFTAVSATNQGAHLQWNRSGGEGETSLINHLGTGTANAGIRFAGITTSTGTVPTEWARFNNAGNFGIGTTTPTSTLAVNGSVSMPFVTANADLTLTNAHYTVRRIGGCNTITLPNPNTCTGRLYVIISSVGSGTLNLAVTGNTGGTSPGIYDDVPGAYLTTLPTNSRITVQSNGFDWIVLTKN
ncbi:hypothetical protein GCM10022409_37000 [Hymenobacter glaciei]|uniref:Uncharacterized protein n=1 Tax=Hymenobacter glaciei TaxID=877209 RepID=A0ABP7UMD5_9BACT